MICTWPPSGVRDPHATAISADDSASAGDGDQPYNTSVGKPAEVYRERVADDDETDSGTAEQKRWESLNREHDRIGSDRFWEIIYEGFRKAGYTTAQLRHLLGMEINPK